MNEYRYYTGHCCFRYAAFGGDDRHFVSTDSLQGECRSLGVDEGLLLQGCRQRKFYWEPGTERKNLNKPSGISSSNAKSMESKSMRMPFRLPSKMRGSHWDWMKSILKNRLLQQKGGENVGDSQRRSVSGTTEGTR